MSQLQWLWLLGLLAKILLAWSLPLFDDEAYYWVWSQRLQLSYYDHPPFIAWIIFLADSMGLKDGWIRLPGLLIGHSMIGILVWQVSKHFGSRTAVYTLIGFLVSPLLGAGSILMTPDLPVICFWILACLVFHRALHEGRLLDYAFFGLTLGLGFSSKYHMVLLPLALGIYLLLEKDRPAIRWRHLPWTIIFGLVGSAPVLIWNLQNDWISFRFQLDHGLGATKWSPISFLEYIPGQLILIGPFAAWAAWRVSLEAKYRYLFYVTWIPLAFFLMSSLRRGVEMNWPVVAYPSLTLLAAIYWSQNRGLRNHLIYFFLLYSFVLLQVTTQFLPIDTTRASEPFRWSEAVQLREQYQPSYFSTYQAASQVWFRSGEPTFKLLHMSRRDFFDQMPESLPHEDQFYVIGWGRLYLPTWIREGPYQINEIKREPEGFSIIEVQRN